jgi:hypothetical protein
MDIYNKSQLSFFSNFPNTIKSITVESNIFTNIIQIIANLNIEPAKLNILGQIEDTSQIHYVKDISTLNTLELEIFDLNPIYTYNFESTSLTSLTISTYIGTTCIDWLLTTFPSLEELRITGSSECKVMNEIDTTKQFPNLWKFTAALSFISQKCVDFLILTAPNMRELDLRANKTPGFSNINIDISGWELRQLNLDVFEILDPVSLFCNVNIQNITKIIKCDPSEQSLAVVKNSSPFRLKKAGVVNIVSTREKQFMFNGFSISLSLDNITIDFKKQ